MNIPSTNSSSAGRSIVSFAIIVTAHPVATLREAVEHVPRMILSVVIYSSAV